MAFLKSSKAIGSMAYYAARVNDVGGMPEQRRSAGKKPADSVWQSGVRLSRRRHVRRTACAFCLAHRRGDRIDDWHGQSRNAPREAGERRASEDERLRAILGDRRLAQQLQAGGMLVLHAADVADRRIERADARQPAVIAVTFDDASIPGADARRNGNDRKALRDLGGAGERGVRKSYYRPVEGFAQCRQARVAERGEDDGVVIGEVVRYANQGGVRADQRLEFGLYIGHPEPCRPG